MEGWYDVSNEGCSTILASLLFHTVIYSLTRATPNALLHPIRQPSQHAGRAYAARQKDLPTTTAYNPIENGVRHECWLDDGRSLLLELFLHGSQKRCPDPARVYRCCEHIWAVVVMLEFLVERYDYQSTRYGKKSKTWQCTFVEAQDRCLTCCVVRQPSYTEEARHTRNSHDMALALAKHVWQEGLCSVPVAEHIDIEDLFEIFI
jgi:hypothetical protein